MKFYLQFDEAGNAVDHAMPFESAQTLVGLILNKSPELVTEQEILQQNIALLEDTVLEIHQSVIRQEGYKRLPNGNFIRNYIIKSLTQEEKVDKWVRGRRDHMLYMSDWSQLLDNELTDTERVAWTEHRKQLRKMPEVYANIQHPEEVVWPVPPLRKPLPAV